MDRATEYAEAKERVLGAGNRVSQILHAVLEEHGILTRAEAADIIDISPQYLNRRARQAGVVFSTGHKPVRVKREAIAP